MITLAIVRHGKANPDAPSGRDADRDLAPRGIDQVAYLAEHLPATLRSDVRLMSSIATRAVRTAAPLATALDVDTEHDRRLFTDQDVSSVLELLREHVQGFHATDLVLVGHNPTFSRLVSYLHAGPTASFELKTGHAVVLSLDPDTAGEPGGAELVTQIRYQDTVFAE